MRGAPAMARDLVPLTPLAVEPTSKLRDFVCSGYTNEVYENLDGVLDTRLAFIEGNSG